MNEIWKKQASDNNDSAYESCKLTRNSLPQMRRYLPIFFNRYKTDYFTACKAICRPCWNTIFNGIHTIFNGIHTIFFLGLLFFLTTRKKNYNYTFWNKKFFSKNNLYFKMERILLNHYDTIHCSYYKLKYFLDIFSMIYLLTNILQNKNEKGD